jgi:hypothetical protein
LIMGVSLGTAAKLARTSKTSINRAIKSGKLSATRRDDGSYEIDPSELARVYDVTPETGTATGTVVQSVTPPVPDDVTLRLAAAEAELKALRELLEEVRRGREAAETQADAWREQASRLVLSGPVEKPSLWRRLVG